MGYSDFHIFNNCSPVSALCVLMKIFERVMYTAVLQYLEMLNVPNNNKFVLRKSYSSHVAFMILMEKLIDSFEKGQYEVGLFLGLSKNYHTVDRNMMFWKLSHY